MTGPTNLLSDLAEQHWMDAAVCAQVDPDLFHPHTGQSAEPAKRICRGCPVAAPCLAYAIKIGASGVWGATSANERKHLSAKAQPVVIHGTEAGEKAHIRRGETPCSSCRTAARVAQRERTLRRSR